MKDSTHPDQSRNSPDSFVGLLGKQRYERDGNEGSDGEAHEQKDS